MVSDISLISRHGIGKEIQEMTNFAVVAGILGVKEYVSSVFYDSVSNTARFEFIFSDYEPDYFYIMKVIRFAAFVTISQFEWYESIDHGFPMQYEKKLNLIRLLMMTESLESYRDYADADCTSPFNSR